MSKEQMKHRGTELAYQALEEKSQGRYKVADCLHMAGVALYRGDETAALYWEEAAAKELALCGEVLALA